MNAEHSETATDAQAPTATPAPLRLPAEGRSDGAHDAEAVALRTFFHGGEGADLEPPGGDWLPAALHPYRNPEAIRTDYPLFLRAGDPSEGEKDCQPLSSLLRQTLAELAPGDEDGRILKDNLPRLEQCLRRSLGEAPLPRGLAEILPDAAAAMQEELALRDAAAARLAEDLERLMQAVPEGQLLALTEATALNLLLYTADGRVQRSHLALRHTCTEAVRHLRDLLRVEHAREERGHIEGAATTLFDPAALEQVLKPVRGTPKSDPARCERIDALIATLTRFLEAPAPPSAYVVHTGALPEDWRTPNAHWHPSDPADLCETLVQVFDQMAAPYAALFAALRLARLELLGRYDATRHAPAAAALTWESFSREELLALPVVLAWTPAADVVRLSLTRVSSLLRSGRPVQLLLTVQPHLDPAASNEPEATARYRFEPAYLGISQREVLVHQTSAARPEHLLDGYRMSLGATRAGLHVIASGLADEAARRTGPWLQAGAALEGRAHPLLHYNPEAGTTWMRRFDIGGNPEADDDWPRTTLTCRSADDHEHSLEVRFTFADFALLEPALREHFRVVDSTRNADHLIPLADYLERPADEMHDELPMIWAAAPDGQLYRLVLSQSLVHLCRDRLNYWRTIQELAGVRNEHVREALAQERARLEQEFAAQRAALLEEHAAEVQHVRDTTAREALERLAARLVDPAGFAAPPPSVERTSPVADGGTEVPTAERPPAPAKEAKAVEPESSVPEAAEAAEELEELEPWITSALCTSCNDCINLNPQLFVYNANKQAIIGDPTAGTFEQLVVAAEKCPARCIHPGLPGDPAEATPELIARAQAFNGAG